MPGIDDEGRQQQRHIDRSHCPMSHVVIYVGATIIDRVTSGRRSSIGGNVWLTESLPAGSIFHQARTQSV
jgi:serine O-acetyltransferase